MKEKLHSRSAMRVSAREVKEETEKGWQNARDTTREKAMEGEGGTARKGRERETTRSHGNLHSIAGERVIGDESKRKGLAHGGRRYIVSAIMQEGQTQFVASQRIVNQLDAGGYATGACGARGRCATMDRTTTTTTGTVDRDSETTNVRITRVEIPIIFPLSCDEYSRAPIM